MQQTPKRDHRLSANVITDLYATPDPCFPVGLYQAPMSATGCSCRRLADGIISRSAFLRCLSGEKPVEGFPLLIRGAGI